MAELDRIAELKARLAQANVTRTLHQEATERLQDANAERDRFQHQALSIAELPDGTRNEQDARQWLTVACRIQSRAEGRSWTTTPRPAGSFARYVTASTAGDRGNAHES